MFARPWALAFVAMTGGCTVLFPFAGVPADAGGGDDAGGPEAGAADAGGDAAADGGEPADAGPPLECPAPQLREGPAACVPEHVGLPTEGGLRQASAWELPEAGDRVTEEGYAGTIRRVTKGGNFYQPTWPFNADSTRFVLHEVDGPGWLMALEEAGPHQLVELPDQYVLVSLQWSRVDTSLAWVLELEGARQSIVGFAPDGEGEGERRRKVVSDLAKADIPAERFIGDLAIGGESLDRGCGLQGTAMVSVPEQRIADVDLGGPDDDIEGALHHLDGKAYLDLSGRWIAVYRPAERDLYDLEANLADTIAGPAVSAVAPGWGVFHEARTTTIVTWSPDVPPGEAVHVTDVDPSVDVVSLSAPTSDSGWFLATFCGFQVGSAEFQGEIVAFESTGAWFVRMGHHQSLCGPGADPLAQGRASVSQDGRFALFTREVPDLAGGIATNLDVYLLSFPTICDETD